MCIAITIHVVKHSIHTGHFDSGLRKLRWLSGKMLSPVAITRGFESSSGLRNNCCFFASLLEPTQCRKISQSCATIQATADDIQ